MARRRIILRLTASVVRVPSVELDMPLAEAAVIGRQMYDSSGDVLPFSQMANVIVRLTCSSLVAASLFVPARTSCVGAFE